MGRRNVVRSLLGALALIAGMCPAVSWAAPLTVILVRHAERAPTPANDPPLSPAGQRRASLLARTLADADISAIYVTEFLRTQQTAAAIATKLHLRPLVRKASDTSGLVAELRTRQSGVVLVVGHSDTIPQILSKLGASSVTIAENAYDNCFILSARGERDVSLLRLHYGMDITADGLVAGKGAVMEVEFARSGGFAAMATAVEGKITMGPAGGEVSSARGNYRRKLAPEEQKELEPFLAKASALSIPNEGPGSLNDGYQYDITVKTDTGASSHMTFHGFSAPPSFEKLAAWVRDECDKIFAK